MSFESMLFLLLDTAIKTTVLLGMIGLCVRLFARHRPALRAMVWSQAFVALLILPVASVMLPALRLPFLPSVMLEAILPQSTMSSEVEKNGSFPSPISANDPVISPQEPAQPLFFSSPPPAFKPLQPVQSAYNHLLPSWQETILGIYLLGVGICLFRLWLGWWRVQRFRRRVHVFGGPDLMARLDHWCHRLGLSDRVDVGISEAISVPTLIGVFRPLIVVPETIANRSSDADWDGILVHELAHMKRHDAYWNMLGLFISALYWYHPFVYWARRDLDDMREYACDDWAVSALGDCDGYANTLLEVTARTDRRLSQALGLDMARTSRVLHRVNRLLNLGVDVMPHMGRWASGAALILMLSSAALLGSLRPAANLDDVAAEIGIHTADEAAQWMRKQYFLRDYAAGYRKGERLVNRFSKHAELNAWFALNFIEEERFEAAQQILEKMLEDNAWTNFARAFYASKQHRKEIYNRDLLNKSLALSQRALDQMPDHADIIWMHGQVLWTAKGSQEAVAFIDQHVERIQNPAELLALKGYVLSATPDALMDQTEKIAVTTAAFESALKNDPDNISALVHYGAFLSRSQGGTKMYEFHKRAAELSPHSSQVHMRYWNTTLGLANRLFEDLQAEVTRDMTRFLKDRENYPEALGAVAFFSYRMEDMQKAQPLMERILREFPNTPEAEFVRIYRYRGLRDGTLSKTPDPDARAMYLRKLWEFVNRSDHQSKTLLADGYRNLFAELRTDATTRPEDLLRIVQGMAENEVHNPNWAFYLGPITLAERTSYYREAETIARQGFEVAKKWGERRQRSTGTDEGYQWAFNTMTAMVHDALGWIYFYEERLTEAEIELLKSNAMAPESGNNLYHLGRLYEKVGEWDRAETFYTDCFVRKTYHFYDDLEARLQNVYQARLGGLAGFQNYMEALREQAENSHKQRVLSERIEDPKSVPAMEIVCIDGAILSLLAQPGKVVVIDAHMRADENYLKGIQKLYDHFKYRDDVIVVHINREARLQEKRDHFDFPMAVDNNYLNQAHIDRFPTTVYFDRQGRLAYRHTGSRSSHIWLQESIWRVEALLKNPS